MSVITIGELELGVLAAADEAVLARRADTLALQIARPLATGALEWPAAGGEPHHPGGAP